MATSIDDELSQIGAALAAAADGEPVDLTDEQREVLARARTEDVLDAVMEASRDKTELTERHLTSIATAWSNELRTAFGDEATLLALSDALNSDDPQQRIIDLVRSDLRLTNEERQKLGGVLTAVRNRSKQVRQVETNHVPAYIKSISAGGFRGIGPQTELTLEDGPGLTVVYGANGSGKSSFVEALDVLLTGGTGRFDGRGPEWRAAWSNLHESEGGNIQATFTVAATAGDSTSVTLKRSWTGNRFMAAAYDESPSRLMARLGWLTALDEFKPVLGYEELGPLFEEDVIVQYDDEKAPETPARAVTSSWRRTETSLARHIRLRSGVSDSLIERLWTATQEHRKDGLRAPFFVELHTILRGWRRLDELARTPGGSSGVAQRISRDSSAVLSPMLGPTGALMTPGRWDWNRIASIAGESFTKSKKITPRRAVRDFAEAAAHAGLYAKGTTRVALAKGGPQATFYPTWRTTQIYLEMLVDAIYKIRLSPFSQRVADIWSAVRPGSAVKFSGLTLRQELGQDDKLTLRASLGLTVDGVEGVERGVLSQGELHTLALSVFLPTMMRPESPFRFAVIDDPVQVMDAHAVDGLAQVLEEAADDLQVIVFTHDERLPKALRSLEIDHTLINVTRSGRSVVECEVVSDPVTQRLADARAEAERPAFDDEFGRRQDVADQCRRAIEAACIRAIRRKLGRLSWSPREIEDEVDWAISGQTNSTRHLMALAIFGDRERIADVADYVTEHKIWGRRVHRTLSRVNELVHASDADSARAAYAGDLFRLIDDVEYVTSAIEANCA